MFPRRLCPLTVLPVAIASAGILVGSVVPEEMPTTDMRQQILATDAVVEGDFTIEFEMRRPALRFDPNQGEQILSVRATRQGETFAMRAAASYEHAPRYKPVEAAGYQDIDFDSEGNLRLWRMTGIDVLSSPEVNDSVANFVLLTVSPDGSVIDEGSNRRLHRHEVASRDNTYLFDQFVLAAGRDFGRHLDRVVESEARADGMIEARIAGSYGRAGTWYLTADPSRFNLVRSALLETESSAPVLTIRTQGQVRADADHRLVLAESGTLEFAHGGHPSYEIRIRTLSVSPEPDQEIIAQVHAAVTAPLPPGGEVLDDRGSEPARTFDGEDDP